MGMRTPTLPKPSAKGHENARRPAGVPEWQRITPDEAFSLLTDHNPRNRNIDNRKVAQYAADMKAGRWDEDNGATIGIDTKGDLVDGQHRLTAVVDSGVPTYFWVMKGLDPESQNTLDIGRRRELGTQLQMVDGIKDGKLLAAAARMVYAYEQLGVPVVKILRVPPSEQQVREVLSRHPNINDSAREVPKSIPGLTRAVAVGLHYLFTYADREDASFFFHKLASGAGLDPQDPILVLRERLIREKQLQGQRRLDVRIVTAFVIRAFNAYRRSERMHKLQWGEGSVFPRIDGITLPVNGEDD